VGGTFVPAGYWNAERQRESGELIAKRVHASFNRQVQFEFDLNPIEQPSSEQLLALSQRHIPLALIRNPRARRYVLRLSPDGSARVTIPRGGSAAGARRFAEQNVAWVERALQRLSTRPARPTPWAVGTEIHFRGEVVTIQAGLNGENGRIQFGSEAIKVSDATGDLRRLIQRHLWRLAASEFPPRVFEFAAAHQLIVRRVTVRNQRSRWGSCSRRGTISLNWRLIQTPPFVRDYLILHELMHLKQMNHSARFWREVERVCPDYHAAERWLKQHSFLLRD
jgi:predicted metal-dependent hydrolase